MCIYTSVPIIKNPSILIVFCEKISKIKSKKGRCKNYSFKTNLLITIKSKQIMTKNIFLLFEFDKYYLLKLCFYIISLLFNNSYISITFGVMIFII